jgi:hypothetical protein
MTKRAWSLVVLAGVLGCDGGTGVDAPEQAKAPEAADGSARPSALEDGAGAHADEPPGREARNADAARNAGGGGSAKAATEGARAEAAKPPVAGEAGGAADGPAAASMQLYALVTFDELLGLHPLLDGSMMISAGPKLLRVDPEGEIHDDAALLAGITLPYPDALEYGVEAEMEFITHSGGWSALQVGGTWPSATFLTLQTGYGKASVYRWAGDRWAEAKHARSSVIAYPRAIRAWREGSLLAWRELYAPALDLDGQCSDCPDEMYETPQYKRAERDLASTKQLAVLAGPAKGPSLKGVKITAFDALASGEAFVGLEDGSLWVLSAAGKATTMTPTGDAAGGQLRGLVARAADDVIGFGIKDDKPFLVQYTGKGFAALDVPECTSGLASLSIAGPTWWVTCANPLPRSYEELGFHDDAGSLWRRESGAWERMAFKDGVYPRIVLARGPDDVWVSAYGNGGGTVLHTRERKQMIALRGLEDVVRKGFFPKEAR